MAVMHCKCKLIHSVPVDFVEKSTFLNITLVFLYYLLADLKRSKILATYNHVYNSDQ